jgi:hypothetical protein
MALSPAAVYSDRNPIAFQRRGENFAAPQEATKRERKKPS